MARLFTLINPDTQKIENHQISYERQLIRIYYANGKGSKKDSHLAMQIRVSYPKGASYPLISITTTEGTHNLNIKGELAE